MNKMSARIIISCVACTMLVLFLFLLAIRLTQPSCELVFIDAESYKRQALSSINKSKPIKSRDKTFLIRLSAHLEYYVAPTEASSSSNGSTAKPQPMPHPAVESSVHIHSQHFNAFPNNNHTSGQSSQNHFQYSSQHSNSTNHNHNSYNNTNRATSPQSGVNSSNQTFDRTNFNSVSANQANENNNHKHDEQSNGEKRFLPIELRYSKAVELKELGGLKYKLKLLSDCAVINLIIVRRPDRVHVEQINLELKRSNRKQDSCEIRFPEGAFGVDTRDWRAHYYCDRLPKYSCNHYSTKHEPIQVADLQIHYLEFEVSTNQTAIHKSQEFATPKSYCDMTSGGNS